MNNIKEIPTIIILIVAVVAIVLITVITLIIIKKRRKQKNQPEPVIISPTTNNEVTMNNTINTPTETPAGINMFNQNINTNINPINPTPEINNNIIEPALEQNNQIPENNTEIVNQTLPKEPTIEQPTNQINESLNNNETQLFVYSPNNNQSPVQNVQPAVVVPAVNESIGNTTGVNMTKTENVNPEPAPQTENQPGTPNNPVM